MNWLSMSKNTEFHRKFTYEEKRNRRHGFITNPPPLLLKLSVSALLLIFIHQFVQNFSFWVGLILFFLLFQGISGIAYRRVGFKRPSKPLVGNLAVIYGLINIVFAVYIIITGINALIVYGFVVLFAGAWLLASLQNASRAGSKDSKKFIHASIIVFLVSVIILGFLLIS